MPTLPRRQRGASLIEAATVIAIVAVLAGAAVPSFRDAQARRQIDGVAALLETDLQLARSEAVMRRQNVRVGFTDDASGSCYVLHTGPAGACQCGGDGVLQCAAGAQALRSVPYPADYPVRISANSKSMLFDAIHGTVTPTGTMRVHAAVGEVRQIINLMGRIRSCSPGGTLAGYPKC